jgi:hypothetical protein
MLNRVQRGFIAGLALLLTGLSTLAMAADTATAATDSAATAGKVVYLRGSVTATTRDGTRRDLTRDAAVLVGDTIATGARSTVLIRLQDGSKFELGPEASMEMTKFNYQQDKEKDGISTRILKGVFRFVTGQVAKDKPENMNVEVGGTATIGIRGTHVVGKLEGEAATVILLEPEDNGERKTAIQVANQAGSVYIDQPNYGTEVADANTAPTPPRRMRLQTIQNLMRTIQAVQRIPTVRPRY